MLKKDNIKYFLIKIVTYSHTFLYHRLVALSKLLLFISTANAEKKPFQMTSPDNVNVSCAILQVPFVFFYLVFCSFLHQKKTPCIIENIK